LPVCRRSLLLDQKSAHELPSNRLKPDRLPSNRLKPDQTQAPSSFDGDDRPARASRSGGAGRGQVCVGHGGARLYRSHPGCGSFFRSPARPRCRACCPRRATPCLQLSGGSQGRFRGARRCAACLLTAYNRPSVGGDRGARVMLGCHAVRRGPAARSWRCNACAHERCCSGGRAVHELFAAPCAL